MRVHRDHLKVINDKFFQSPSRLTKIESSRSHAIRESKSVQLQSLRFIFSSTSPKCEWKSLAKELFTTFIKTRPSFLGPLHPLTILNRCEIESLKHQNTGIVNPNSISLSLSLSLLVACVVSSSKQCICVHSSIPQQTQVPFAGTRPEGDVLLVICLDFELRDHFSVSCHKQSFETADSDLQVGAAQKTFDPYTDS